MPKRSGVGDDTGDRDAPEVIATRRKAKVSSRFRRTNTSPADAGAASAPSAFAAMAANPEKSGFVFGSMGPANEPASSSPAFSFGASTSTGTAGVPTPAAGFAPTLAAGFAPTPAAAVFAPPPAASVLAQAPAAAVFAPTPAAVSSPATGFFSFKENAPAAAPVVLSKPLETTPLPVRPSTSVPPVAVAPKVDVVGNQASSQTPASIIASGGSGLAFGEGRTAAQGVRLNKLFARWIAHQLSTNSASTLDTGLRDYVTFAAEIRDRVEILGEDAGPAARASFTHPSASTATTSEPVPSANPSPPSTAAAANPPRFAAVPAPVAAPAPIAAPAPLPTPVSAATLAPVATTAPAFTFSSPSTLPAAPSGPQFSFGLQTAAISTKAAGAPAVIAPSATSPTATGFKLNGVGFGGFGAAPDSVFNGFQAPAGVTFAPPAPAMAAGGAAAEAEDDGMPKEDPSKLERAPGEEDEEIVCHFRAKLFRFKMDEKTWGDMGLGLLRLMKHKTNGGRRLVLRNDMGKVLLNAGFYEGMKVTKTKNAVKFTANIAGDGPTPVMIKVTANEIEDLHTNMLALVPP